MNKSPTFQHFCSHQALPDASPSAASVVSCGTVDEMQRSAAAMHRELGALEVEWPRVAVGPGSLGSLSWGFWLWDFDFWILTVFWVFMMFELVLKSCTVEKPRIWESMFYFVLFCPIFLIVLSNSRNKTQNWWNLAENRIFTFSLTFRYELMYHIHLSPTDSPCRKVKYRAYIVCVLDYSSPPCFANKKAVFSVPWRDLIFGIILLGSEVWHFSHVQLQSCSFSLSCTCIQNYIYIIYTLLHIYIYTHMYPYVVCRYTHVWTIMNTLTYIYIYIILTIEL